jgi:hypothetical protein
VYSPQSLKDRAVGTGIDRYRYQASDTLTSGTLESMKASTSSIGIVIRVGWREESDGSTEVRAISVDGMAVEAGNPLGVRRPSRSVSP